MTRTMPGTESLAEFDGYVRDVTRRTAWLAAGLTLASLALCRSGMSVALGIALGSAFSIVKFRRRAWGLAKAVNAPEGQQARILIRGRMESFLMAAVAVALAFSLDCVHNWAAVLGLFLANIVVVACAPGAFGQEA